MLTFPPTLREADRRIWTTFLLGDPPFCGQSWLQIIDSKYPAPQVPRACRGHHSAGRGAPSPCFEKTCSAVHKAREVCDFLMAPFSGWFQGKPKEQLLLCVFFVCGGGGLFTTPTHTHTHQSGSRAFCRSISLNQTNSNW